MADEIISEHADPVEPEIAFNSRAMNPASWHLTMMEADCGHACTPNGCCGHTTDIPETLEIGGVTLHFNPDDLTCKEDFDALRKVGNFLQAFIKFHRGLDHHQEELTKAVSDLERAYAISENLHIHPINTVRYYIVKANFPVRDAIAFIKNLTNLCTLNM